MTGHISRLTLTMPIPGTRSPATAAAHQHADVASAGDDFGRILRALRLAAQATQRTSGLSAAQLFLLAALGDGAEASLSEDTVPRMSARRT